MADVFLSYRNLPDRRSYVRRLATILRAFEVSVWWDYGLEAGEPFRQNILDELTQATVVVPVWCEESVQSRWVAMEAELGRDKLLPVRFQAVSPPSSFESIHAADLVGWSGAASDLRLQRFIQQLGERLSRLLGAPTDMLEELSNLPVLERLSFRIDNGASPRKKAKTQTATGIIRFRRTQKDYGSAVSVLVLVDGEAVARVSNGTCVDIRARAGRRIVQVQSHGTSEPLTVPVAPSAISYVEMGFHDGILDFWNWFSKPKHRAGIRLRLIDQVH